MNLTYLFIVNPVAGLGRNHLIEDMIHGCARTCGCDAEIIYTKGPGHAAEIAQKAVEEMRATVVVVGGDGTVNEVAAVTMRTGTALGIVPGGSGNGLARHYGISMKPYNAIHTALLRNAVIQDAASINDMVSFNVSGIGLDALIAHKFDSAKTRGFNTYMKILLKELPGRKVFHLDVETDQGSNSGEYLLTSICTASQFGNNAVINPHGSPFDGLADLVMVKDVPFYGVPSMLYRAFYGDFSRSRYVTTRSFKWCNIKSETALPLHIDGEVRGFHHEFKIQSLPRSLYIIVPKHVTQKQEKRRYRLQHESGF